ncbi:MAG: SDR family oxidoreductase [Gammaproteobacteria bacterium]|nr:SDR family oxidoreductase [Gammaproteobacteria bacterium]
MQTFKDKTIIITGASAGVGAAVARAFAAQGANLVLNARGAAALDKIAAELGAHTEVLAVAADMASVDACESLIQQAKDRFGRIDVLVNNAGLHIRGDVETNQPRDYATMVDVNLRAPIVLSAAALPHIKAAGGGAIVMIGSLAGMGPLQGAATYSATKAGLRTFTYALSDELRGSGVQVAVVSPGPINTGFIMDEMDKVEDIVFSQPMSSAEQVADNVLELASGDQTEIAMPWFSGKLVTMGYLFPRIRRALRPKLYAKGRKNKQKYRQQNT